MMRQYCCLREAPSSVAGRDAHAEHANLAQPPDHLVGNARFAVDAGRIDVIARISADLVDRLPRGRFDFWREHGIGEDRLAPKSAEEQVLGEPGPLRPGEEQFLGLFDLLAAKFGLGGGLGKIPALESAQR